MNPISTQDGSQEQQPWKPNISSEIEGNCKHSVGTLEGSFNRVNISEKEQTHEPPSGIKNNLYQIFN